MSLRIAILVHGCSHAFDMAHELLRRGDDVTLFTNYPRFVVGRFGVPPERARSLLTHGVATRLLDRLLPDWADTARQAEESIRLALARRSQVGPRTGSGQLPSRWLKGHRLAKGACRRVAEGAHTYRDRLLTILGPRKEGEAGHPNKSAPGDDPRHREVLGRLASYGA